MFTAINPATQEAEPFRFLSRGEMDTYDRLCASGRVFTVKIDAVGRVQGYDVTVPDGAIRAAHEKEQYRVWAQEAMEAAADNGNQDRRVQEETQMSRVREQQAHAQAQDEELGNL